MSSRRFAARFLLILLCLPGCHKIPQPDRPPAVSIPAGGNADRKLLLDSEPAGSRGVIAIRREAADGEEVVVVGRVAGSRDPIVPGRAAFTLVDLSLEDGCGSDHPWVFCCTPKEDLQAAMVLVKFTDHNGKTLALDARKVLGLKEWQTVVVRGRINRDPAGNIGIAADHLFIRP